MTGPYQEKESPSPSLVEAATAGDLSSVKALLEAGADVNTPNQGGQTPLILAAVMGHSDVVAHLIHSGADPQLRDHLGLTAYEWSTRRGFQEIEILLAKISTIRQSKLPESQPKVESAKNEPIVPSPAPNHEFVEVTPAVVQGLDPTTETSPAPASAQISYEHHDARPLDDDDSILDLPESLTSGSQPLPQYFDSPTPAKPLPAVDISSNQPPWDKPSASEKQVTETSPSITRPILPIEEDDTVPRVKPQPASSDASWVGAQLSTAARDYPATPKSFEADRGSQLRKPSSSLLGLSSFATDEVANDTRFVDQDNVAATPSSPTPVVVWLLIAFVLGASAFAAYRLTRYLYRAAEPPAPTVAPTVEAPAAEVKKPSYSVGGDLAGTELNIPEPALPFEAARSGAAGLVTVRVRVNKNGRVIAAAASSGDRSLRAAAVKAAKQASFSKEKLAELNSRSRVVSGTITYEFAPAPAAIDNAAAANNAPPATATPAANVDANAPQVSETLVNAAKSIPAAEYPAAARRAGLTGSIIVTVRVNRNGKVISWRSSNGDSKLRAAAIKAARKATFAPDKLSGDGDTLGTITYNFVP